MSAIDGSLEPFLHGPSSVGIILLVSLALGLRHAADPDHLAAVTTLIASAEEHDQVKRVGLMGLFWGLGHGTTLVLVGLPLVLMGCYLPQPVQQIAETTVGVIIVLLAIRLLVRWRRGLYHAHNHIHNRGHPHRHVHSHVHSHVHDESRHHSHLIQKRGHLSAFGIGLVHGIGGSGGLTMLLVSTITNKSAAAEALLLFAAGTAISMALLSTAFGLAIASSLIGRNLKRVAPVLGVLCMAFGAWYALGVLGVFVHPF